MSHNFVSTKGKHKRTAQHGRSALVVVDTAVLSHSMLNAYPALSTLIENPMGDPVPVPVPELLQLSELLRGVSVQNGDSVLIEDGRVRDSLYRTVGRACSNLYSELHRSVGRHEP